LKLINFQYHTELAFSSPASDHHFLLKILPQSDDRQTIKKISWRIDPPGVIWHTGDTFGNRVLSGYIDKGHKHLNFGIEGAAETRAEPYIAAGDREETLRKMAVLLYPSELTRPYKPLAHFYDHLASSAPKDSLERLQYFSNAVHKNMRYERGITTPRTTAQEAFDGGIGVCQDFAHILLAVLRLDGVMCRYIAGIASDYGETHAWVEALIGDRFYGVDPTRDKLVDEGYLAISRGRDFNDCSIERGIFKGSCVGTQTINLRMEITE
jgi:transglutaminase-like putative cysteine protease